MIVSKVQLVFVVADTLTSRARSESSRIRGSRAEALLQATTFVNVVKDLVGNRATRPNNAVDTTPTTLKVLMAPEFYFRRPEGLPEGQHHFTQEDAEQIRHTLFFGLKDTLNGQPWLLMPGTIVWSKFAPNVGRYVVYNTLFGLDFTQPGIPQTFFCNKQNFSSIDGLTGSINGEVVGARGGFEAAQEQRLGADVVFNGNQVALWYGTEICLDHLMHVLSSDRADRQSKGVTIPGLALHLVVGCGVDIVQTAAVAHPNGYVLRCNGNGFNNPRTEGGAEVDQVRSDIYRWDPSNHRWGRLRETLKGPDRFQFLPPELQRPSRPDGTFDGVGVALPVLLPS